MSEVNINLCHEVLSEIQRLEVKESGIQSIQNNKIFVEAYNQHNGLQRTMLTTLLFKILMSGSFEVPAQIRIALNSANDTISWLDDIKLVILPFIKVNEDNFFPTIQ
jgi:hypothetical protein